MNSKLKSAIQLIVSLIICAFLLWLMMRNLSENDKAQIIESIKHIRLNYVFILIFLSILACIIRAFRWKLLLNPLGYFPRNSSLICSIFIMYLGNLMFPRLGEVLRCSILQKKESIPIEKSIGTMIVERVVDVIGLGCYVLLALVFEYDKIWQTISNYQAAKGESSYMFPMLIAAFIVIGIIVFFKAPKIKNFIIDKIKGIMEGLLSISKLEHPILFIIYSISIYTIYFLGTYLFYFALSGTENLSLSSALIVLIAGTFAVGLTQGGLIAFQILVTQSLELYDIPKNMGLAYSWALWLIQTITLVVGGIVAWIYISIQKDGKGR
jgi:glycosyltransferase 2 family protein